MRKSKLELYEDLLCALAGKYLSIDSMAYECNMDCVAVRQRLDFLIKNRLVEEKECHNKKLFALTTRGTAIYKTLAITRRLENLKTTGKLIGEALQLLSGFPEHSETKAGQTRRKENY
jgi:predicted transcriptional regulator